MLSDLYAQRLSFGFFGGFSLATGNAANIYDGGMDFALDINNFFNEYIGIELILSYTRRDG